MFNQNKLHNAYLITTSGKDILKNLEKDLEKLGIEIKANPDYILWRGDVFGIDDARKLKEHQNKKNIKNKQCFVIETISITREAQNALLKTFEEPGDNTHFFLCVPNESEIIVTLKSRMIVIKYEHSDEQKAEYNFLKLNIAKRMKKIEKIVEDKNKKEAIALLNNIEESIHEYIHSNKGAIDVEETKNLIGAINNARSLIIKNIGNMKILLENIALSCPILL